MLHLRVSSDAPLRRHISRPGHHVAGMVQHRPCSRPPPGRRLGRCTANHVRDDRQSVREHVNRTGCARGSDPTDARSPVTPRPYPALTRARQDVNAEPRTAHERSGHAYAKHVNGLAVAPTALPAGAPWERVNAARSVSRTGEMQHDHRDPSARRTGAPCAADGPSAIQCMGRTRLTLCWKRATRDLERQDLHRPGTQPLSCFDPPVKVRFFGLRSRHYAQGRSGAMTPDGGAGGGGHVPLSARACCAPPELDRRAEDAVAAPPEHPG